MNRTLSRTILGLLVLVAGGIVSGGAAQPPGTSVSSAPTPQADLPSECLLERNFGACVTCCIEAYGVPGNVCSHFCKNVPPPLPGPEPQP